MKTVMLVETTPALLIQSTPIDSQSALSPHAQPNNSQKYARQALVILHLKAFNLGIEYIYEGFHINPDIKTSDASSW